MTTLSEKVQHAIQSLNLDQPKIQVHGAPNSVFATVVSSSFSGVNEAERQRRVWEALRQSLDEHERVAVEFVFTIAPDDPEEAAAGDG